MYNASRISREFTLMLKGAITSVASAGMEAYTVLCPINICSCSLGSTLAANRIQPVWFPWLTYSYACQLP